MDRGWRLAARPGRDGAVAVHDVKTGKMVREIAADTNWDRPVVFSPDGSMIAIGVGEATAEEGIEAVAWKWETLFRIGSCYERSAEAPGTSESQQNQAHAYAALYYRRALDTVEQQRGSLGSEAYKAFFAESKSRLYDAFVGLCLSRGKHAEAVAVAERCRSTAFMDLLGQKALKQRQRDGGGSRRVARVPAVQNPFNLVVTTLKPKSVVLEYYLGRDAAHGFLLTRKSVRCERLSASPRQIAAHVGAFRARAVDSLSVGKLTGDAWRKPLADLYAVLVEPFEKEVAQARMVYIVPHGVLHYLPFQALIDRNGAFLIEKVNVAYTPTLNVLRHCRAANRGNKTSLLAVANPDTGWAKLPATEREAAAVSTLFAGSAKVVKGAQATEGLVKEEAGKYDVIAFATHGEMVWEEPTQSNLRFTPGDGEDGRWTVSEIFDMDLRANLVALSACETGLARGHAGELPQADDFVGLTRAFMYAGVPSVVASLWKVSDDSTTALMTEFFTNWKQKGMDKAEALREAQLAMIRGDVSLGMVVRGPGGVAQVDAHKVQTDTGKNLGRHPYFWAPFVLIGDYR